MSDGCTCRAQGLCGACTTAPSHTEAKTLAEYRSRYAPESTSYIAGILADELEKVERCNLTTPAEMAKKAKANREADLLLDLLNDRRGRSYRHRDETRRGSAKLGKHVPAPRQADIPHYRQKPGGKR